jgi:hypothetical protein
LCHFRVSLLATKCELRANIFDRPNGLEKNWKLECSKFFPNDVLRVKELKEGQWQNDRDLFTIWIVRNSNTKNLDNLLVRDKKVRIHAAFADESHSYMRTKSSQRVNNIDKVFEKALFAVHLSGTLFPLDIRSDAQTTLQHLGGPFFQQSPHSKLKWTTQDQRTLCRLFGAGREAKWSMVKFRLFIGPFTLRRTESSKWNGQYIIPRDLCLPEPIILSPRSGCPEEAAAASRFHTDEFMDSSGKIDKVRLMTHADNVRQRAWSCLYDSYMKEKSCITVAENTIKTNITKASPSYRQLKLLKLIRTIRKAGEKFLIVTDMLFLVRIAVAVLPFFNSF